MGQVRTTFTSEDKDVQKALDNMTKAMERLRAENKKLQDESRNAAEERKRAMQEAKQQAEQEADATAAQTSRQRTLAMAWEATRKAISLVNQELERNAQIEARAAQAALGVAQAEANALMNMGFVSPQEQQGAIRQLREIGASTGIGRTDLSHRLTQAASSKGLLTGQQMLDTIRETARLTLDPVAGMKAVGGANDLASLTGRPDDPKGNLGFQIAMQSMSRVADPNQISANLVPGALGLRAFGAKPEEAGALVATFTNIVKDQTGAQTGTAMSELGKQLNEFSPDKTVTEAIFELQRDPKKRQQFWGQAHFEAKVQQGMLSLLTGGTEASNLFANNLKAFPDASQRAALFDQFVANKESMDLQKLARFNAQRNQIIEAAQLDENNPAKFKSEIRSGMRSVLEETGAFGFEVDVQERLFDIRTFFGADPREVASGVLRKRKRGWDIDGRESASLEAMATAIENLNITAMKQLKTMEGIQSNQRQIDPNRHAE